jgi:hypothetical protein
MSGRRAAVEDIRAALPGWVLSRALVLVAWVGARWWIDHRRHGVRPVADAQGLFAWDGVFYRGIAGHGYRGEDREALRFFPLYPVLSRLVHVVSAVPLSTVLLIVANLAALVAAALVHRVMRFETGDRAAARRAATYVALVPPAFVLSWAYAEGLLIALAVATVFALRCERWALAAVLGFVSGLTRPTGVFLALAALIEAGRGARRRRVGDLVPRAVAVAAPVAGAGVYLWWVGREFGDWHIPIHLQDTLRGGAANPIVRAGQAASDLVHLDVHGLHFPFAVAMVVLAVIACRHLPLSYGVFAVAIVVTSLAATNLNSIERYGLDAFPLVMALAIATPSRLGERITTAVCAVGLVSLAMLAWLGTYVP